MQNTPPKTIQELQTRANQLAGRSIASIADELNLNIPADLLHAKGWIGQLIEAYLGASANNLALPDFPNLGIELKTVPIDIRGKPLESTYVCTAPTKPIATDWRDSWVYNKLRHVLWVPIIANPELAITHRTILSPILWQMDAEMEAILRVDWEELTEALQLGYAKNLSSKLGTYLHLRPKAANSKVLVDYLEENGNFTKIVPKGFYLRTSFTREIIKCSFANAASTV